MSLEACLKCVKKSYVYTGDSCLYSLKDQQHSENEMDPAKTKADCAISYTAVDHGLLGIGLTTRAEMIIVFSTIIIGLVVYLTYRHCKTSKIIKDLKSLFLLMLQSNLFPTLAAIRSRIDGPFRTFFLSLADKMGETLQQKAIKSREESTRNRNDKWQQQLQKQREKLQQQQQQQARAPGPGVAIRQIGEDDQSLDSYRSSHEVIQIQAEVHPAIMPY